MFVQLVYLCVHVSAFVICIMQISTQRDTPQHASTHLYVSINAWGQDRDRMKDCQMCGNAVTDHFYHIILWVQVCKCVTCLCFSGYLPVLAKWMMKWSQMGKRTKQLPEKKKKRENEKEKKKTHYECQAKSQESAPFHTIAISIPQRRKSIEKRKVTLQWPWNYWFHRAEAKHNFSGSWQVWGLIIVLGASAEFLLLSSYLCDSFRTSLQKHISAACSAVSQHMWQLVFMDINVAKRFESVFVSWLFSMFTSVLLWVTVLVIVINEISCQGSLQPCTRSDWYVDRLTRSVWHHFCLIRLWLMGPVDQGQDHDIWPPLWMSQRD